MYLLRKKQYSAVSLINQEVSALKYSDFDSRVEASRSHSLNHPRELVPLQTPDSCFELYAEAESPHVRLF